MNALGNRSSRMIPIRQRSLHPSFLGLIDTADTSVSDPGQSGSLSPYCDVDSMYFDNSLYENEMHYKLIKYLDEYPLDEDNEELVIKCDNEEQYNAILDTIFKLSDKSIKAFGVSNNPMEIIIEKDIRDKYRKFDESLLLNERPEE